MHCFVLCAWDDWVARRGVVAVASAVEAGLRSATTSLEHLT